MTRVVNFKLPSEAARSPWFPNLNIVHGTNGLSGLNNRTVILVDFFSFCCRGSSRGYRLRPFAAVLPSAAPGATALWNCVGRFDCRPQIVEGRIYRSKSPNVREMDPKKQKCAALPRETIRAFPLARRLRPPSDSPIMNLLESSEFSPIWGRNGFDGITGRKMRAEDHALAKNMETKVNC